MRGTGKQSTKQSESIIGNGKWEIYFVVPYMDAASMLDKTLAQALSFPFWAL